MGKRTAKVSKACHIFLGEDLSVFEPRTERRDVGFRKRGLERVEHDAVRPVSYRMHVLRKTGG